MSFIQREIDRIRMALTNGADNYNELYAAQQALEWALEPTGIKAPYAMIMGFEAGSAEANAAAPSSSGLPPPVSPTEALQ